jgi:predicted alpha-1,2-mannosidase
MTDVSSTVIEALCERLRLMLLPALAIFCAALPSFAQGNLQSKSGPAALVNPLIGTANSGNTFPGAVLPFGMVAFSPEELLPGPGRGIPPGGYAYSATTVRGFSLAHLSGAGCTGSGDFLFMPLTANVKESPALDVRAPAYLSELRHDTEHAVPGYYSVQLRNSVLVELSATRRSGAARFTYPAGQPATLLIRSADNEAISTNSQVAIDPKRSTVSGWLESGGFCRGGPPSSYDAYYKIFFVAHFDRAFAAYGTWKDATVQPSGTSADGGTAVEGADATHEGAPGRGSGAYVSFANPAGTAVAVRVGISYVSEANAEANLRSESPEGISFDSIRTGAFAAWNAALGSIAVKGGTREQQTVFYTALYHSLLHMNVASDVNGEYRGMDEKMHRVTKPQIAQYANFSGWDVYRSQVQLVALLFPKIASDMAQSLLNQADQWGCWSRWTHESGAANVMNGDPSDAAIAEIAAFAGDGFAVKQAYASLLGSATTPHEGHRCSRPHLEQWLALHYLTASNERHDTSAADTLEFSTADFALSQLAAQLGRTAEEKSLLSRAQYWKNLFNPKATPQEGYVQARNPDGSWKNFDPASSDGFVEGTGAQYLWMVPFNVRGLFQLLGGNEQAIRRLDSFFHDAQGNWALLSGKLHPGFDNEPCLETPWLYDFAGAPYKTQQTIRAVVDTLWRDAPDGIPGNDDLGEMSSWYVWAALGVYPEIPGRAELVLASPLFPEVEIHRPLGTIRIVARSQTAPAFFIASLRVNGRAWTRPWLPATFIRRGGTLEFDLGNQADTTWGASASQAPPSFDSR